VMLNIVKTTDRQTYLNYTRPYADNPNTILSRREKAYNSIEELFGKTVSVPKGFFYEEVLRRDFPKIKLHLVKDTLDSMKAVSFGKADAALGELAVFNHLLGRHLMTGLAVSGEVKLGDPELALLNMASRKAQPLLASILDKAIKAISVEEDRAIRQKWLGETRAARGVANAVRLTEVEKAWLAEHPEIRLGVDPNYPPFDFIGEDGKYSGIASDYVRLVNERLGTEMKVVSGLSWPEVVDAAKHRRLDVLPAAFRSADREAHLSFTRPYATFPIVILTRQDYPFVAGLNDLAGKTVALVESYAVTEQVQSRFPGVAALTVANPLAALHAVAAGKAEATVMNLAVATHLMKRDNLANIKIAAPADVELPWLTFAVRRDWPELVGMLDKALATVTPAEESAIRAKWISVRYEYVADTGALVRVGLQVGAVALVILGIIVIWNRRLQREILRREATQRELAEKEALLRLSLDQMSDGIYQLDGEFCFTMFNDRYKDLIGVPDELTRVGRSVVDTMRYIAERGDYGEGEVEALIEERISAFRERKPIRSQVNTPLRNLEVRLTPTIDGGMVALASDITERYRAEQALRESERRFAAMLKESPIAVTVTRLSDNKVIYANARIYEMFDLEEEEFDAQTSRDYYADKESLAFVRQKLAEDGFLKDAEVRLLRRGNKPFWAWASFMKIDYEGEPARLAWFFDIDQMKQAEETLKRARDEAEAAAQAKSDFIAVVSHEVRTPMNGVLGMARLILETPLIGEQREFAQTILDSGEALLTILNDLLDISKLEAGKLEIEDITFSPRRLIADTANVMRPRALEKGLRTDMTVGDDVPAAVIGDANRLRQIVFNLVSNAIKFTDVGGVRIALDAASLEDGQVKLSVAVIDTGTGIAPEAAENLFAPYTQANVDVARRFGGTGLGLSISRRLAELMGGEITLQSELGKGSVFTLSAPFEVTAAPAREAVEDSHWSEARTAHSLRILLVEDNLINRKVAEGMLRKLGHKTVAVENGREALDLLAMADPFDVILMDRHMPVMDGIEATERIRALEGVEGEVPIVGLTAAVTQREIRTCLEAGMNDVVTKPIDPLILKSALLRAADIDGGDVAIAEVMVAAGSGGQAPVIDRAVLATLEAELGAGAVAEFSDDFRKIGPENTEAFLKASAADDHALMTHYAHDLKSAAAIVGLMQLSDTSRTIEVACKDGRIDAARSLGAGLQVVLAEALAALDNPTGEPADEAERSRADFLAKMSHDLRNAMNTMLGYVLMLQEGADGGDGIDDLEDYAANLQTNGARMLDLSANVLALLQIEAGHFAPAAAALTPGDIARFCLEAVVAAAPDRGVGIEVSGDDQTPIAGDVEGLHRLFANLAANAARGNPDGVNVRLGFANGDDGDDGDGGGGAVITVEGADFGEDSADPADPFAGPWSGDGDDVHANLRLTVAAALARGHGGSLVLGKTSNGNACATVTLPQPRR